jgi:hypothetical protein
MVSFKVAATFLVAAVGDAHASLRAASMHRKLSFESIAGYEPKSLVTDHVSRYAGQHSLLVTMT